MYTILRGVLCYCPTHAPDTTPSHDGTTATTAATFPIEMPIRSGGSGGTGGNDSPTQDPSAAGGNFDPEQLALRGRIEILTSEELSQLAATFTRTTISPTPTTDNHHTRKSSPTTATTTTTTTNSSSPTITSFDALPDFLSARHIAGGDGLCRLVLIKTCSTMHSPQEFIDRLTFESIVRQKIYRAEREKEREYINSKKEKEKGINQQETENQQEVTAATPSSAMRSIMSPSAAAVAAKRNGNSRTTFTTPSTKVDSSMSSRNTGVSPSSTSPSSSSSSFLPVFPHLRTLADFRVALIFSDPMAITLEQAVAHQWYRQVPQTNGLYQLTATVSVPAGPSARLISQPSVHSPPISVIASGSSSSSSSISLAPPPSSVGGRMNVASTPLITLTIAEWSLTQSLLIAKKLHLMHSLSLLHRSLHPSTIVLDSSSRIVEFLDLSHASLTSRSKTENHYLQTNHIQSLPLSAFFYIAPESSGKVSGATIDARSDLYSLGCIMYELFTGHPPFQSQDQLELIHAHLAKNIPSIVPSYLHSHHQQQQHQHQQAGHPFTPHTTAHQQSFQSVLYSFLLVMDEMIHKLMAKAPEDRYQSAAGLIHDLKSMLGMIQKAQQQQQQESTPLSLLPGVTPSSSSASSGSFTPLASTSSFSTSSVDSITSELKSFKIAQLDHHSTFRISQRLYGREDDLKRLFTVYQQVSSGSGSGTRTTGSGIPQLCLISGYSGVGKTVLVDELHKHNLRTRGLFARSKFDLLKRDSSCLLQAFRHLIVQLQIQDALTWRVRVMRALGPNALVLAEVMPELATLIGDPLPPVPRLSTAETATRFNQIFMAFISCLASVQTPLVVFIDDLQWADSGSLALLQLLLSHDDHAHLLVVGSYRDNEVSEVHPLVRMIGNVKANQGANRVTEISLRPLQFHHISQLLIDSFRCSDSQAGPLAQLLLSKTQGNPFYITQMLKSFYDSNRIWFDFEHGGGWTWQIDAIRRIPISSDVVDLLCARMSTLSHDSQRLLQYASCSGNSFTLASLAVITQMNTSTLVRSVLELEQSGMLMCTSQGVNDLVFLAERLKQQEEAILLNERSSGSNPGTSLSSASHSSNSSSDASATPSDLITNVMNPPPLSTATSSDTFQLPIIPSSSLSSITMSFVHDKVQTAAFKLIPKSEIPLIHCSIVEQLLMNLSETDQEEYAIDIVGHLNTGYLEPLRHQMEMTKSMTNDSTVSSTIAPPTIANSESASESHGPTSPSVSLIDSQPLNDISRSRWSAFLGGKGSPMIARAIELELNAGKQAKIATAYDSSLRYLAAAAILVVQMAGESTFTIVNNASMIPSDQPPSPALLAGSIGFITIPTSCWQSCYSLCVRIYVELAQTLFLASEYSLAEKSVLYFFEHVTEIYDRASLFDLHLQTVSQLNRMQEAVELGLAHLHELGIELLTDMYPELVSWLFDFPDPKNEATYVDHPALALEEMRHPVSMTLLSGMCPALYFLGSPQFSQVIYTMLQLTMTRGLTPESSYAFSCYALIIWPQHRLYAEQYALGRLAKMILEQYGEAARSISSRANTAILGAIYPWKKKMTECVQMLEAGFEEAMAIGDNEWGGYLGMYVADILFVSSIPLSQALSKLDILMQILVKKQHPLGKQHVQLWLDLCLTLAGLKEDDLTNDDSLPTHPTPIIHSLMCITRGIQHFYSRRHSAAVTHFEAAQEPMKAVPGLIPNNPNVYYRAHALLAACPVGVIQLQHLQQDQSANSSDGTSSPTEPTTIFPPSYDESLVQHNLEIVAPLISLVRIWSDNAPHTFKHKYLVLQAERIRVMILSHLARYDLIYTAMQLYDDAIEAAQASEMRLEHGTCLELAASFYTQLNRISIARTYTLRADQVYADHGAHGHRQRLRRMCFRQLGIDTAYDLTPAATAAAIHQNDQTQTHAQQRLRSSERQQQNYTALGSLMFGVHENSSSNNSSRSSTSSESSVSIISLKQQQQLPSPGTLIITSPQENLLMRVVEQSCDVGFSSSSSYSDATSSSLKHNARLTSQPSSFSTSYSTIPSRAVTSQQPPSQSSSSDHPSSNSSSSFGSFDILSVLKATASFSTEKNPQKLLKKLMAMVLEIAGATRGILVLQDTQTKEWKVELRGSVQAPDLNEGDDEDASKINLSSSPPAAAPAPVVLSNSLMKASPISTGTRTQPSSNNSSSTPPTTTVNSNVGVPATFDDSSSAASTHSSSSPSILTDGRRLHVNPPSFVHDRSLTDDMSASIPVSIFHYVVRSVETVLLSDPHAEFRAADLSSAFSSDPYFESHYPRACLCLPVLKQAQVIAVLYIENDFDPHAFTSSHIQLLQLLCGQAALSIDNARLYAQITASNLSLQQLVLTRTSELETLQRTMIAAEKAMRIKSEFLSNMSHEIRTPMNAVLGLGRLLAETTLSLEQQQLVLMIQNSGRLLLAIINDILDLSKMEAGRLKLHPQKQNLLDVVENAVMLCYDMAHSKGLELVWSCQPEIEPAVMIDSTRLQQILLNLLSNAIKFTSSPGRIKLNVTRRTIVEEEENSSSQQTPSGDESTSDSQVLTSSSSSVVAISTHPPSSPSPASSLPVTHPTRLIEVSFSVSDTGVGIAAEHMQLLFQAFSQVHHMSAEYAGTGLGLVISQRLVQAMGGKEIHVQSQLGKGSTFTFCVKCSVVDERQPAELQKSDSEMNENEIKQQEVEVAAAAHATAALKQAAVSQHAVTNNQTTTISDDAKMSDTNQVNGSELQAAAASAISSASTDATSSSSLSPSSSPTSSPPSVASQTSSSSISSTPNLHGLSHLERSQLSHLSILYTGDATDAAHIWIDLLRYYGAQVHSCETLVQAKKWIQDGRKYDESDRYINTHHDEHPHSHDQVHPLLQLALSPLPDPISDSSHVLNGLTVIADLDSRDLCDDSMIESLAQYTPIKLICLYSKRHMVAAVPIELHASTLLVKGANESQHAMNRSTIPSPPSVTSLLALSQHALVPESSASVPTHSSQLSTSENTPERTVRALLNSDSRLHIVQRHLKKPFKLGAFLHAVLEVSALPIPIYQSPPSSSPLSHSSSAPPSQLTSSDVPTVTASQVDGVTRRNPKVSQSSRAASSTPTSSDSTLLPSGSGGSSSSSGSTLPQRNRLVKISHEYPLRVLLAEDNVINQKVMMMMMKRLGYEIQIACNGREALAILEREALRGREYEIQCILMDASMDVLDGLECTRVIRSQQLPNRIRPFIIAQTANVTDEYKDKCLQAGLDLFMTKPIEPEALIRNLQIAYQAHQSPISLADNTKRV